MAPALIILNPQNDFFGVDNPQLDGFLATVPLINQAIKLFHVLN